MVKTLIVIGFLIQGVLRVCAGSLPLVLAPPETSPRPEENSYVSGLAFYSGKLYVGLGLGLMVVENGAAARLFAWEKKGTPVEWVSYDRANNLLWACLPWRHELARFDGKVWQAVPFPKPSRGFISRGDVLRGYRGVSNGRSFWFEGAGRAWTWRGPKSGKWTEVPSPPAVKPSNRPSPNLKRLLPTDGRTYCIRRDGGDSDELAWGLLNDSRTWDRVYAMNRPDIPDRLNDMMRGDSVWFLDGQTWNPVNCAAGKFLAEETVATTTDAYIRTKAGGLLGITGTNAVRIAMPGPVEALFGSESGRLMAVFQGLGVYELRDQWSEVLKLPFTVVEGGHEVLLAASGGEIALAVHGFGRASRLWISQNQAWKEIPLPRK